MQTAPETSSSFMYLADTFIQGCLDYIQAIYVGIIRIAWVSNPRPWRELREQFFAMHNEEDFKLVNETDHFQPCWRTSDYEIVSLM